MQELPFHTATQWVGLAITLVAGWFFGLASARGGRQWRERYQDADLEHSRFRKRVEGELDDANRRIRELEKENARLAKAAATPTVAETPVVVPTPAPVRERRED